MVSLNTLIVRNVHSFSPFIFCRALLEAKVAQKKLNGRGQQAGLLLAGVACAPVDLNVGQWQANAASKCSLVVV